MIFRGAVTYIQISHRGIHRGYPCKFKVSYQCNLASYREAVSNDVARSPDTMCETFSFLFRGKATTTLKKHPFYNFQPQPYVAYERRRLYRVYRLRQNYLLIDSSLLALAKCQHSTFPTGKADFLAASAYAPTILLTIIFYIRLSIYPASLEI